MPLTHESEGKNFKTNGQESIYIYITNGQESIYIYIYIYITREREGLIKL
jgi:hypothetical protein